MRRNYIKRESLLPLLAQFCAAVLLLALLLLLAGCGRIDGTTPSTPDSIPTAAAPTEASPTAAAPTELPTTEAPGTEVPTVPAEPEPADPRSLLGEVDAVERTVTFDDGSTRRYSYALPCILADTEGARAINADIEDRFGDTFRFVKERIEAGNDLDSRSLKYCGVVWEDVLSVIVTEDMYYDWTDYAVYCYEIPTGRWLTTPLLLERMGFSEEEFLEACRTRFRDRFMEAHSYLSEESYESSGYYSLLEEQTRDEYVNLDLMAYPENGDLVVAAPILSIVGPEYFYQTVHLGLGGPLSLLGEASFEEGTYTDDCGNVTDYSYAIPRILADTEGARAINAAIDDYFGGCVRGEKECMEDGCSIIVYSIGYTGHVWEDILTVEIPLKNDWGCDDYGIYCYSTATGEWLTTAMLLERMGISEEDFLEACRERFRQTFTDQYRALDWTDEQRAEYGYDQYLEQADSDRYVNMDLKAYPNAEGRLVVIAPIVSLAGAEYYYHKLYLGLGSSG